MIFHWIVLDLYPYDLHKNAEKPGVISFLSQIFCQKAVHTGGVYITRENSLIFMEKIEDQILDHLPHNQSISDKAIHNQEFEWKSSLNSVMR